MEPLVYRERVFCCICQEPMFLNEVEFSTRDGLDYCKSCIDCFSAREKRQMGYKEEEDDD